MEKLLSALGLSAGYGKTMVLRNLNLEVEGGSVVTVIGSNGAGKTTLLDALMGVLPSTGSMRFDNQEIAALTLEQRVMVGIALVPEKRELFGTMSVEDNLKLGGRRLRRRGVAQLRDGLEQAYEMFPRLKERRKQVAGTLSGGERQMLAIARALMGQPRLLMLDEPSLGLAPLIVRDIFRIIERLRAQGVTILLVEQNTRAALEVADYAYVLETGEVVLEGPAADLAADSRVIDAYLGVRRAEAEVV